MTDAYTPERAARVILDMFQSHNARPGEAVLPGAVGQLTVAGVLSSEEAEGGVQYGLAQRWFEEAPMDALRLTEAGFAEIQVGRTGSGSAS